MSEWKSELNLEELRLLEGTWLADEESPESQNIEMGSQDLGFHTEYLSPGKFSNPRPFNHVEEEICLVLEGKAMLRQSGKFREVLRGEVILSRGASDRTHQFYNHTDKPFRILALSTQEDIKFWPKEFIKD